MIIRLLTLFSLLLFSHSLEGQGILNAIELLPHSETEETTDQAPNPSGLQNKWYTYFNVEPEKAYERIDQLAQNFNSELNSLSPEEQRKARQTIEKISTSIRAVIQSRQNKPPAAPGPVSILESYTQGQILEAFRNLNKAKEEAARILVDIEELNEKIEEQTDALSDLRSRYAAISEPNSEKFLIGLEIIGLWGRLTVSQEELQLSTLRLRNAQFRTDQYTQEVVEAEERLISDESLGDLQTRVLQLQQELSLREEQLLEKETMSVGQLPETPLGDATKAHLAQETLLARLQVAITEIDLEIASILLHLEKMLTSNGQDVSRNLFDNLEIWTEERRQIEGKLSEWETDTAREHKRAFQGQLEESDGGLDDRQLLIRNQQRLTTADASKAALERLQQGLREASYLSNVLESRALNQWSRLGQIGLKFEEAAESILEATTKGLSQPLFFVGEVPLTLWSIFRAFLILIGSMWLSRWVQAALERMGDQQKKIASATFYSLGRLAHYLIVGLGTLFALLSLGLDLTTLALVAGALSVGIGFGLQGIVNNFLSGLIILFEGQLKVGDFLELESGWRGVVTAINMRSTVIRSNRGIEVLIPNSEIIGQRTINWTMSDDYRRMHIPFGVSYQSDKELVRKVVLEAADRVPHTVKGVARYRDPMVWLTGFGDNSLDFELVVWVNSPASKSKSRTTADYYWEIHSALMQNNIEIPYPQRDLHLRSIYPEASETMHLRNE